MRGTQSRVRYGSLASQFGASGILALLSNTDSAVPCRRQRRAVMAVAVVPNLPAGNDTVGSVSQLLVRCLARAPIPDLWRSLRFGLPSAAYLMGATIERSTPRYLH